MSTQATSRDGWQSASDWLNAASEAAQEEYEQSQRRQARPIPAPEPLPVHAVKAFTARQERLEKFAELMREGKTVAEAACHPDVNVALSTGREYERELLKTSRLEAS